MPARPLKAMRRKSIAGDARALGVEIPRLPRGTRRAHARAAVREATTRERIRNMLGLVNADRGLETATERDLAWRMRPRTRGDCRDAERPCPWKGCRHHLGLDVAIHGGEITSLSYRADELVPVTCSLDVADRGVHSLDEVAALLGVSRERARQIESEALHAFMERIQTFELDL